jgi:hypothetical protein
MRGPGGYRTRDLSLSPLAQAHSVFGEQSAKRFLELGSERSKWALIEAWLKPIQLSTALQVQVKQNPQKRKKAKSKLQF